MFKLIDLTLLNALDAVINGDFTKFNSYNESKPINSNKRTKARGKTRKRTTDNSKKWYTK